MADIVSLVLAARRGDEEAFGEIVTLYTPMMQRIARKYSFDFDEVFSELCMSLYRAVSRYDVSQSEVTFGLFAEICASRCMCDVARRQSRDPGIELGRDVDEIAAEADLASDLIRKEENENFRRDARGLLSQYEYSILLKWLGGDKTADIASSLSVSAKSVDNAKARILKKLRDGLRPFDA